MNARALLFLLAVASIAVSATPALRGLARAATKADAAVAVAMVGAGAGAGAGAWAGAGAGDDAAPGAVLSVSQKGITCWVNELTGKISDLLGNVNVPDQEIHFSHGDVQLSNMHTHDLGGQEFSFSVTPAPGVEVSAKFTVHFAFNFHYNVGGIAGNGQCEFTFVDSSVAATAALGADGSQFALTASDASMQLGSLCRRKRFQSSWPWGWRRGRCGPFSKNGRRQAARLSCVGLSAGCRTSQSADLICANGDGAPKDARAAVR